jgi:hypothetical protein
MELSANAARVRAALATRAAGAALNGAGATTTYGALAAHLDPTHVIWRGARYHGLGKDLGDVSRYEHERGAPLLSALVVQAGIGRPGAGFAEMARELGYVIPPGAENSFWREELLRVVKFWHENDPSDRGSDLDQVRALLAQAQETLGRAVRLAQTL